MIRVLFVCLGNICRSPTAEGVFRRVVDDAGLSHVIEAASAGTHAYHIGEGADPRSSVAAKRRGYDLAAHKARRVREDDFTRFDYILAMDRENLRHLEVTAALTKGNRAEVRLLLDFAPTARTREVPDPYARGDEGFEHVLDLVESACEGLLDHIRERDLSSRSAES